MYKHKKYDGMIDNDIKLKKEDSLLLFSTFWQICALIIQLFLYNFFGYSIHIHEVVVFSAALPMVFCVSIWLKRNLIEIVMLYLLLLFVFALNYLIFPENRAYLSIYTFELFFICLPSGINISLVRNIELYDRVLRLVSLIILIIGIAIVLFQSNIMNTAGYSMSFSYYLLLPVLYFTYKMANNGINFVTLIAVCIGVLMIIVYGSRGSLITWCIYVVAILLFSSIRLYKKLLFLIPVFCMIVFSDSIISLIVSLSRKLGASSRTLNLYLSNELLFHDSGRKNLYMVSSKAIKEHPLIGNGIGADYRLLDVYTHNIVLDFALHYGVIIGFVLVLILVIVFIKTYMDCSNKNLFIMFFCYGLIPLLFSGTYFTSVGFFVLLGFCRSLCSFKMVLKTNKNTYSGLSI